MSETVTLNQEIEGLRFERTCIACPEQYDVTLDGVQVGYVRLRGGALTASMPDAGDPLVFAHYFEGENFEGDQWKGTFDSDEERGMYLVKIAQTIKSNMLGGVPK